jgi:hypothetical protein
MDLFAYFSICALSFSRHVIGIAITPYQTYRVLVDRGRWGELVYIGGITAAYFALASLVKTASFRPFLLTKQFLVLTSGAIAGYLLVVGFIGFFSMILRRGKTLEGIAVAWGYTMIPTVLWFFATSLLYVILPPPRTESFAGVLFSLFYLTMSVVLLFWKIELYYLTLRFGLRLDLLRIIALTIVFLPVVFGYSMAMYALGIFRVPFL